MNEMRTAGHMHEPSSRDVAEAFAGLGLRAPQELAGPGPWLVPDAEGVRHAVAAVPVDGAERWDLLRARATALLDLDHENVVPVVAAVPVGDPAAPAPRTLVVVRNLGAVDDGGDVRAPGDGRTAGVRVLGILAAACRGTVALGTCGVVVPGPAAVRAVLDDPSGRSETARARVDPWPWCLEPEVLAPAPAEVTRSIVAALARHVEEARLELPHEVRVLLAEAAGPGAGAPGDLAARALAVRRTLGATVDAAVAGASGGAGAAGAESRRAAEGSRGTRGSRGDVMAALRAADGPVSRSRRRGSVPRDRGRGPVRNHRAVGVTAGLLVVVVAVAVAVHGRHLLPADEPAGPGATAHAGSGAGSAAPTAARAPEAGTGVAVPGSTPGAVPHAPDRAGPGDPAEAARRATVGRVAVLAGLSAVPADERGGATADAEARLARHVAPGPVRDADMRLVGAVLRGETAPPRVSADVRAVEVVRSDASSATVEVTYSLVPGGTVHRQSLGLVVVDGAWRVATVTAVVGR